MFGKKIFHFFDKLEDHVREYLSLHPILYSFISGIAIVLFWRGIWVLADETPFLSNGFVSVFVSVAVLLVTGLFVSFFVGDVILMSGLRKEKKLIEKTEDDVKGEEDVLREVQNEMHDIKSELDEIKKEIILTK